MIEFKDAIENHEEEIEIEGHQECSNEAVTEEIFESEESLQNSFLKNDDLPPAQLLKDQTPINEVNEFGRAKYKRLEPLRISRSKSLNYRKKQPIESDNSSLPDRLQKIYSPLETGLIACPGTRNPTVIIHKKQSTFATPNEFKINAISPISGEEALKMHTEMELPSSIIYPLKYNGSWKTPAVFDEEKIGVSANLNGLVDDSESLYSNQTSNLHLKTANQLNIPKIRKKPSNKYKNIVILLLVIVVILLCAFIPSIIILANGTYQSVKKYYARQGNELFVKLMNKYIPTNSTETNNLNGTIEKSPNISNRIISNKGLMKTIKLSGILVSNETTATTYSQTSRNITINSFNSLLYGVAYSPLNAMEPECGITKNEVMLDMQKLSSVTKRVRNYGMQCEQSDLILGSIQTLGLDMKLAMGVWIGHNDTSNKLQMDAMKYVLKKYPRSLFETIFIGNEVLFREDKTTGELIEFIEDTKNFLQLINYDIPVGTSEIGSLINKKLIRHCDIIGANVHPFFGGETVESAVDWVQNFIKYQLEPVVNKKVEIVVTEVGWPTGGGQFHKSVASVNNFKRFISNFLCQSRDFNFGWYFFEAFDEPWKEVFYVGDNKWETEWGIFNSDRSNKVEWEDLYPCV
jgi:exo-beta-1,3-glucanase (GH17 family)